jgi:hypothetical protein
MYNGRREFRSGRAIMVLMLGATALFVLATYGMYRYEGWTWKSIAAAAVTVILCGGGILETLILRIELADDALVVTDLRGRRRYDKQTIDRIEESKGGPPAIKLKDGRWVRLPSVGSSLGNSVRAWLKQ